MSRSPIAEVDLYRIRKFCDGRIPPHAQDQVRLEVDVRGSTVTVYERRAPRNPRHGAAWSKHAVASLRCSATHGWWTPFWIDQNAAWHRYPHLGPTPPSRRSSTSSTATRHASSGADHA